MIDTFQKLKLKLLKFNLKQNWTLPNEIWNEEIPHDYMYEDTYLQLSFVFNTFTQNELSQLIKLTSNEKIDGIVACIMALSEAMENKNKGGSTYDDKEIFFI